jgi:hypothetical protein
VGALGTNGFFDCGSRKAAWRKSRALMPGPVLEGQLKLDDKQFVEGFKGRRTDAALFQLRAAKEVLDVPNDKSASQENAGRHFFGFFGGASRNGSP